MRITDRADRVLAAGLLGEFLIVVALAVVPQVLDATPTALSVVGICGGLGVLGAAWYAGGTREPAAPRPIPDGGREYSDIHYARSYSRTIERGAEGDVTARLEPDVDSDALRGVATSFNEMMANYESTLRTADASASEVATSAAQLTSAAKATKETSEGVSETVRDIVTAFHEQHEQVAEVSDEIHDVYAVIERTSRIREELSRKATQMQCASDHGTESAQDAFAAMSDVQSQSAELSEMIATLEEKTNEIERIVELINTIADETTSLALDASLEVVRGDANRDDLGDVADEITSLADDTKEATSDIEMHLEDIQGQTDRVVSEMEAMEETADEGMATADDAVQALSLITENVSETVEGVEDISDATDELTDSAEEIAESADHMAAVSEETIDRAEGLEYIVEEVTLALGEIYVNTKNLEIETTHLVGILDWFTTDDAAR